MTRSLSADLRGRVIAAIEDGISTREAARRFRIGISTAGRWYRRYRQTGEMEARKQGQPSRSKLDAHEAFIFGLIEGQNYGWWQPKGDFTVLGLSWPFANFSIIPFPNTEGAWHHR